MTHKVTVGLQQKIGQPNFGSIGAKEVFETSRGRNYDRNIPFSVLVKAVGEIVLS